MKRSFTVRLLLILMALPAVCAATPLTTLHALRALSNEDVALNPFVSFEATVIYFDNSIHDLKLQDGRDGIFVHFSDDLSLMPGDRVRVEGRLMPSFLPYLAASRVEVLHHGTLPAALPASFGDLVRTRFVSIRVKVLGRIRAADLVDSSAVPAGRLQMVMEGGYVDLELETRDLAAMRALLDTEVEVVGVAGRKFDSKMQQTGVRLRVLSLSDIHVLHPAPADPWSLPASPLGSIFTGYHVVDKSSRLHVRGILTYYEPTIGAVLQNGRQSLWIDTAGTDKLEIGDQTDAIGFPVSDEGRLMLIQAQLRPTGVHIPLAPLHAEWSQLAGWTRNSPTGHGFDLVSMDANIVSQVRTDHEDRYVLDAGGSVFSAIFRHRAPPEPVPSMPMVGPGSRVRVTGICWIAVGTPQNGQVPFDILLNSPDDVVVLQRPPLWNVRNLAIALGIGFLFFMILGARTLLFERRARQRSAATARIERRRRRILEGINAMRPLADLVEEITGVVSLQLQNAPCWCNITGGATLGPHPGSTAKLHVVDYPIPARAGGLLGSLHVGLPAAAKLPADLEDALSMGAGLVAVAIEARHLYTDLVHRSEFDQLTGLCNRAALDQKMEAQVQIAREQGSIFALIYIDFDDFKQVNDTHGHRTGDLFLEEAARRMKAQLRPCDQLARLGGDEFAALVTNIRSRDEVEEVALRLKRCLAEPFRFGEVELPGSASTGIALYPADATCEDGLLTHADTAMYASKAERKSWRESS